MKIQYLNYYGTNRLDYKLDSVNSFNNPTHFNSYNINIIDLRDEEIWQNSKTIDNKNTVDIINDFHTINSMSSDAYNSVIRKWMLYEKTW